VHGTLSPKLPVKPAPLPPNEAERLRVLRGYAILDTPPEPAFDDLARLAAQICGTPFSGIAFVDERREWLKARVGVPMTEIPRDLAIASHAVLQGDLFVVEDASRDERFADHPLVTDPPRIRFYASVPLVTAEGTAIGTVCVADRVPRRLTPEQAQALQILTQQILTHLELRRSLAQLDRSVKNLQHSEEALRNSEALYHSLVAALPQSVFRKDCEGRYTFGNASFCALVRRSLPDILGRTDLDLLPSPLSEKFMADWQRVVRTGQPLETLEELHFPDGRKVFQLMRTPIRDAGGGIAGVQGVYFEVTQLKRVEDELREKEARFRQLAESIREVFWLTDWRDHKLIYVSPAYQDIWGRSPEALHANPNDWLESIYVEDRERVERAFFEVAERGGYDAEYRIVRPDGGVRWIHDRGFPIRDAQGQVYRIAGLAEDVTARRQTEDALRSAEAKYHSIYENVVEGIFQTTPDGQYLSANPMLARIYGYETPEDLMAAVKDIKHQLYVKEGRREEFARLMQQQEVISEFESEIYRKDGSVIWISENARAVRDRNGRLLYYEGTVQDITARKRAEQAVRDSEALYHSLVESLPLNIFRKDLQERFSFANKRFCDTLGRTLEDIVGKTDFDFFPEEFARKYQQDDRRVMQTREPFETVEDYRAPDGEKRCVQVTKSPLYDAAGNVIGVQGMFLDVTEKRKTEEALAHERDLLRALLDHVPDRIYFKDKQSRFLRASGALAERLGLKDPEEVTGKTDFDFHPEAKAREFFEDEQRIIATGVPLINKIERQTGVDGGEIWASVTKVPIYNAAGEITGIIGISRDITALKRIEDELAQRRDEALALAKEKSQFLATMSHEIRTPMNGILGIVDLLRGTKLTVRQRDWVETIRNSADALVEIINDILDFSKLEAGKLAVESEDFDLSGLVESLLDLLAERAQAKDLELISFIPPDVPLAGRGDPGKIRQVLTNLLGNAIKFTEQGEIALTVAKEEETDHEVHLKFLVRDTGIGVSREAQSRIFQPFTQADGSTTRKYGGTGLGLAISRQLVELMGGHIGVESEPGQGSTFWFTVKLEKLPAAAAARPYDFSPVRALVVDENAALRQALQKQLAGLDIQSGAVANGREALELLRQEAAGDAPFTLLLTDYNMPGMDGLALARAVKEDPVLNTVRIILLSTSSERQEAEALKEAGVSASLVKPVKRSRLEKCLAAVVFGAPPVEEAGDTAVAVTRERASAAAAILPKTARILLAEDNAVNQKVALQQLKKLGYTAEAVGNGREVLTATKRDRFDLVLMDCQMPEVDGYEATRQLRAREQAEGGLRHYIIAMTANALLGDREGCLAAGMDDYIVKPVKLDNLLTALNRAGEVLQASAAPVASVSNLETIDPAVLASLRDLREPGAPDPVTELIELFLRDTPGHLQRMQVAADKGDVAALQSAAHSLKGSANNMGARRLATLCGAVEKQAKTGELGEAPSWLGPIKAEFAQVQAELEAEKNKSTQTQ
jgi:PAS domain S-box-containing protein